MRIAQLFLMAYGTSMTLLAADCGSAIQINEKHRDGQVHLLAKNTSSSPMIAYVLAAGEPSAKVYSGVYSGRDSLAPGKSIEIDVRRAAFGPHNLRVDYVRLADGWTCGNAITEAAKNVVARFQK